jgi:hypothetical protein
LKGYVIEPVPFQTAYLFPIIIGLAWLLRTLLPLWIRQGLVRRLVKSGGTDPDLHPSVLAATVDLVNPVSVGNVLFMAYTELLQVIIAMLLIRCIILI